MNKRSMRRPVEIAFQLVQVDKQHISHFNLGLNKMAGILWWLSNTFLFKEKCILIKLSFKCAQNDQIHNEATLVYGMVGAEFSWCHHNMNLWIVTQFIVNDAYKRGTWLSCSLTDSVPSSVGVWLTFQIWVSVVFHSFDDMEYTVVFGT